ncbi:MerR family transcriptional regulator [bacterium]|nr:MerR family transcriptional regulator [bacterium]
MKTSSKTRRAHPEIRLRQLVAALRAALPAAGLEDLPGRVRDLPDERTLRFYTTLGLLAPPLRFDGRRAMYGVKHLVQLLAVKRLQSRGMPVREIRDVLRNLPPARVSDIARIDSGVLRKAMESAAGDPALNLWPRKRSSDREASSGPGEAPSRRKSVRAYRAGPGLYVTVDASSCALSASEIGRKLSAFAKDFFSARQPAGATPGGGA